MRILSARLSICLFLCAATIATLRAQDISLDQLLKKLPPPEKVVKNPMQQTFETTDPVMKDPSAKQIAASFYAHDWARAFKLSQQLVQRYPQSYGAHCVLGLAYLSERNYPAAEAELRKTLSLQSKLIIAYYILGGIQAIQHHWADELATYERVIALQPENALAFAVVSSCEGKVGRKGEAVAAAKKATALSPALTIGWLQLAIAQKGVGNTAGCLSALSRAADLSPDNAFLFGIIGCSYINLNRIPEAIPPLQRAVAFAPRSGFLQAQLGFCLEETGQLKAGMSHLTAIHLVPRYAPAYEHLGLACEKQGDHRDALKEFRQATKLHPTYKLAWEHLAQELRIAGRTADADKAAAYAQQLKPERIGLDAAR